MNKPTIAALLLLLLLSLTGSASAQKYEMTFHITIPSDTVMYIGQHFRDQLVNLDSARIDKYNNFVFKGKKKWETGIYALYYKKDSKSRVDFSIDGSQKFSIKFNIDFSVENPEKDISGSPANVAMFSFNKRISDAKRVARDIQSRQKSRDPNEKLQADKEMQALADEMDAFEGSFINSHKQYRFFQLVDMFNGPDVPEDVENKSYYYREHYWDDIDLSDHSLTHTPDLFNKMNYYFFGLLFHADKDTICKYADAVLEKVEDDTAMLRYFLDFIMPKYYRSTDKIGWDATWCYLVRKYYLSGKCTWATPGEISSKRQSVEFLEKSLIGARGAELWMADTNQSSDTKNWISSHRQPYKYVILWFWDPDCHHCQEQTAELKVLYDSLSAAGTRNFEIYAVGYESDVPKWKKYVRDHQLPFINVGGPNVNIDYQEAYNVHGAPTMIILNEERRIIMNKRIAASQLLDFFARYEKSQQSQNAIGN